MADTFVEIQGPPRRVFRVRLTPDTPGVCRRSVTVTVEAGPPMEFDRDELDGIMARFVADLVGRGIDVVGWGYEADEDDG